MLKSATEWYCSITLMAEVYRYRWYSMVFLIFLLLYIPVCPCYSFELSSFQWSEMIWVCPSFPSHHFQRSCINVRRMATALKGLLSKCWVLRNYNHWLMAFFLQMKAIGSKGSRKTILCWFDMHIDIDFLSINLSFAGCVRIWIVAQLQALLKALESL